MDAIGSFVWLEDPHEAWVEGQVVKVNGPELEVLCSGKKVHVKASDVYPKDTEAPSSGVDDMTKLAYLHEPGVLQNLRSRYDKNEIYTYIGNILIAVNPFTKLPHLYNSHEMARYKGAASGELSPHPFALADAAYRLMINEGKSQTILVSGESGAGKTESTKHLMSYLAYMGERAAAEGRNVQQQILESNPVLEAFGNAKTVKNSNSSRFGKYVEIQFDHKGRISGAAVRTYLLERSRVCQISDPERNYHCFYMLCAAPKEDIERFKLEHPRTFHYLNQSNCFALDGVDDSEQYIATRKAMGNVGISSEEQDAIFRVVAAILHLGNVDFVEGKECDSSMPKDEKSWFHLETAAELLMCDTKAMEDSLCKNVIVTGGETIKIFVDPHSAADQRDALAKILYSSLFDWIVEKINNSIGQDPDPKSVIGVLDIYGFESFQTNSFEQFCINLTNEKLQQHFNQHIFKMEQEEYTKEGIDWTNIDFVDNQDVLDLIEKKPDGIIAVLDDACMYPASTHETFARMLYQRFDQIFDPRFDQIFKLKIEYYERFRKSNLSPTDFTIRHYAGDVTYQTKLFLEKNKDSVKAEHQALLSASQCSFVSGLIKPLAEESSKQLKFLSTGSRFKQQLHALLETLSATKPHYIRCVKPNNLLKPATFESKNVLQQLRCGGVMEAIRISCAGYPTRRPFAEFVDQFGILAPEFLDRSSGEVTHDSSREVTICKALLREVGAEGYQIGKTKVFLRAGQMEKLDARRTRVLSAAIIIQKETRCYLGRRSFVLVRKSTMLIQAVCRGQLARQAYESMRRSEAACLRIQKYLRMHIVRKAYKDLYSSAICVQSGLRGMAARWELQLRKQIKAAIVIQSHCRKYLARVQYSDTKNAAIATQCAWRGRVARRELRKLKMAARENGALQATKHKLEKQVEELMWELQLEKRKRADLEESKYQDNAKLQCALNDVQLQLKQSKELFLRDQEAAKGAAEVVSVIQEVSVIDHTTVEKLSSENGKKENLHALIKCVVKNIGFSHGKPIVAFTIYKSLLHWNFEDEKASVSDQLIQMIGSAIESEDSNDHRAYWLSITFTLSSLLQRSLKAIGSSGSTPHGKIVRIQTTAQSLREKIYEIIRDNLKADLGSLLFLCIQAPSTCKGSLLPSGRSFGKDSPFVHWQSITECLNTVLRALKENFAPPILVQKIFSQTFSYINAQLFNSLLLRPKSCTWSNGHYLKAGLAELELWCCQAKAECAGSSWKELEPIRQAVAFLVFSPKYRLSYDQIARCLFPLLSVQQLARIFANYQDDAYDTESVSPEVISGMKEALRTERDSISKGSIPFLLHGDSSIPFSVDELCNSLQEEDFGDGEPAEELLENQPSDFHTSTAQQSIHPQLFSLPSAMISNNVAKECALISKGALQNHIMISVQ